jgi:hypothetical protein
MGTTVADVAASCLEQLSPLALGRDDGWHLRRGGDGERLGEVQLWSGPRVPRVVVVELADAAAGLTSWMLHAFAPSDEPVPHLGMDVVSHRDGCAVFADLLPRVDLAVQLDHAELAYGALTPLLAAAAELHELRPESLPPRQVAVLSPWRLSLAGSADALEQAGELAVAYVGHWAGLAADGVPPVDGVSQDALVRRDRVHRAAVVDPDLDPVWRMAERLIGAASVTTIRELLANP